jgi:3-phenylpropionate/cinnamic acid dioxygenase small subunit
MLAPADEREITALLTRYATGIDTRDWPLFEACFAEDARTKRRRFTAAQIL